jgi:DNA primase
MAIPDEDVAQVRAATDIVALIGEYSQLKRVGRSFVGLCPFHSEKTPSFSVNGQEGLYYCFGCQASGDAISFLRAIEGCDFVEAVDRLGARTGINVRHEDGSSQVREQHQALKDAMGRAVAFYHERLLRHDDASRARQYLRSRGYDGAVVRQFQLGWAPASGSQLVRALSLPARVMTAAGLAHEGNYGLQDAFRGRVIFPIFDPSGVPIALGGRLLPGEPAAGGQPGPKYRNSSETPIYAKRRTLYGLNWARQAIVQAGEVVVCEGYTDVIAMAAAGVTRAVATCGTSLTDEHFRLMARFAKRVVLAFDADAAGESAAARFYEWERRHDLEVAVAALPDGSDPGDLARTDPDGLKSAVGNASPFLHFRVERVLASADLTTAEGRARAANGALAIVAEHPNELVRDQYLVTVADRTHIDTARLRTRLGEIIANPGGPPPQRARTGAQARQPGGSAGRDALVLAIEEPAVMADRLHESLFADELQRQAYLALASSNSLHEAIEQASEDVADLLVQLAVTEPEALADQTIVALARTAARRALNDLNADARTAEADGDLDRLAAANSTTKWLQSELETMQEPGVNELPPPPVIEAADRLVAWLSGREGGAHDSQRQAAH